MSNNLRIKKGFDIKLVGLPQKKIEKIDAPSIVVLKPSDFKNVTPKLLVNEGDAVKAGQKIFFHKDLPEVFFTSPVSGEIVEIVRVEKRRISQIKILTDKENSAIQFNIPSELSSESVKNILLESGAWTYIRQRPFDMIPDPQTKPKSIFVSLFDTAPLAPDYTFILDKAKLQKGLEILSALSEGKLNVSVNNDEMSSIANKVKGVNVISVSGPHPAGNVGIQIHHTDPIRPGETVWYVNAQDVAIIGELFLSGIYTPKRTVGLVGSGVVDPRYFEVIPGQAVADLVKDKIKEDNQRIIQGNVLSGTTSNESDFISHYTNQVTVITEGNQPEFFGWALPGFGKLSLSRSFFSWLTPNKTYDLDTNTHGEERAFVVSGEYDKVLPMNIMPVILLKSILAKDIERMEALGIHEISEEDFALCEFVCTSKIDVQNIVREGLELIRMDA
ncbi:Na(+)-translocating NADH-quinone reductase subunit A [Lacihabitans sp. LS3-19]|uniref:Na(+)-translocating NADH-quinone reductase subunit A n=1 Tax=Lacihabitans sp. LS3-19 TaxID=2487335 RepID=UPI0020CE0366|nr:Na(+)-translocating NADH-quinone reductase subunit A [Lacihabitans sp. LS3-19]MCP9767271.1 Na(+)-translocating NADH-quinone reductase subunit A [Lacihabitans sp. LS3-19]